METRQASVGGGDDGADPGVDVLFKLSKLTDIILIQWIIHCFE